MAPRAVVFDLDGVLMLPSFSTALEDVAEKLALPRGFLSKILNEGGLDGPYVSLVKGEITYCQFVSLMEEHYRKNAKDSGISLANSFSVKEIFDNVLSAKTINRPMLQAVIILKQKGFTTCMLTNNYVDDSTQRGYMTQMIGELRPHFDFLIESCRIGMAKPDPQIYRFMLDTLKASPKEVVYLDDAGSNLKPARDLGVVTILVHNTTTALQELEKVTGIQLLETAPPLPLSCKPSSMSHGYVPIKPGVHMHFVELGSGFPVCLCHGFPESWFSWRYQIPVLAQAGFRVLALDMKGYGDSSSPPEIEEYSLEVLCEEMVIFLDKLGISQAVFIGHDWGGMLVWQMAVFYPERVRAVASLNTPYIPANPNVPLMEIIKANPLFDYQLYFQEPGVAEAELERDLSRTFKSTFRSYDDIQDFFTADNARKNGGVLMNTHKNISPSRMVTEEDIQFYVQQFKKSGFRGPLNWYRNINKNWEWTCKAVKKKILIPALMVVAEKDSVLIPEMSKHMEDWIPNLKRGYIKDCGHWTQMDKPNELNQILTEWLKTDAKDPLVLSML